MSNRKHPGRPRPGRGPDTPRRRPHYVVRIVFAIAALLLVQHLILGPKAGLMGWLMSRDSRHAGATTGSGSGDDVDYAASTRRNDWPPLADKEGTTAAAGPVSEFGAANYYIVLDGSGSMNSHRCAGDTSKIEAAVSALDRFIGLIPKNAHVGLAAFDRDGISERVPIGPKDPARLSTELEKVRADGGTPLRSAISLGYEALETQARKQLGYGEYHLVVVTDGQPEPASEDPTDVVQDLLAHSPVVLHTIGFCIGTDHVLNQPGRTFYASADDPDQLKDGLQDVLAEVPAFDAAQFSAQ